jgi:peptide/nickel transport system substrate-binding protein
VTGLQLQDIVGVRALEADDRIVEIVTDQPAPLLLTRLETVAIVPRDFDPLVPSGTGPYRWVVGSEQGPVVLRRWKSYWQQRPDFEEVNIQFVEFQEELAVLLHRGQLDVVASVSSSYVAGHLPIEHWRVEASRAVATTYLGLNLSSGPLDRPLVREAIETAIDQSALLATVFPPGTAAAAPTLVPPEVFGYRPEHRRMPVDVARARELLREAGLAEQARLRLDCAERYLPVAEFLASALAQVGLDVEINAMPYEVFYRRLERGETELSLFTWSFRVADASLFLEAFVHSRDGSRGLGTFNGAGIADRELDQAIDLLASEPSSAARLERLQELLSRVIGLHAYIPLFQPKYLSLAREGVVIDGPALTMPRPQDVRRR